MENVVISINDISGNDEPIKIFNNETEHIDIDKEEIKEVATKLLREKRDEDLKETDKYFSISDATYPNIDMIDLKNYRQQLRDITKYASPTIDIGGNLVIDYYPTKPNLSN